MKKVANLSIAILSLFAFVSLSYSVTPGSYLGAGLGSSKLETPDENLFNVQGGAAGLNSRKLGGLGGRAYAGYNFNQYFGIEAGIARYARSKYDGSMNIARSSLEYSMNAIDLVAKTYLPFGEKRFNLFALGGVAAVSNAVKFNDGGIPFINDFISPGNGSKTHSKIRPIYGIGLGYDIPKSHITTSVELSRIQGVGNINTNANAMPPANMLSFSITYHFGS